MLEKTTSASSSRLRHSNSTGCPILRAVLSTSSPHTIRIINIREMKRLDSSISSTCREILFLVLADGNPTLNPKTYNNPIFAMMITGITYNLIPSILNNAFLSRRFPIPNVSPRDHKSINRTSQKGTPRKRLLRASGTRLFSAAIPNKPTSNRTRTRQLPCHPNRYSQIRKSPPFFTEADDSSSKTT